MDIDPPLSVSLSRPTFHALRLVARIDEIALEEIVETLVAAYLETRLRAIQAETPPTRSDRPLGVERGTRCCQRQQSEKREDNAQAQRFPAMTLRGKTKTKSGYLDRGDRAA
jgi:hypothetical protein